MKDAKTPEISLAEVRVLFVANLSAVAGTDGYTVLSELLCEVYPRLSAKTLGAYDDYSYPPKRAMTHKELADLLWEEAIAYGWVDKNGMAVKTHPKEAEIGSVNAHEWARSHGFEWAVRDWHNKPAVYVLSYQDSTLWEGEDLKDPSLAFLRGYLYDFKHILPVSDGYKMSKFAKLVLAAHKAGHSDAFGDLY